MRLSVRTKILAVAAILTVFMAVVGVLSIMNLGSVNTLGQKMYSERAVPNYDVAAINTQFMNLRRLATYPHESCGLKMRRELDPSIPSYFSIPFVRGVGNNAAAGNDRRET